MLRRHRVALGCWGIPEGCKATFSRAEFYGLAQRLGVISDSEVRLIASRFNGIWHRDLSD